MSAENKSTLPQDASHIGGWRKLLDNARAERLYVSGRYGNRFLVGMTDFTPNFSTASKLKEEYLFMKKILKNPDLKR